MSAETMLSEVLDALDEFFGKTDRLFAEPERWWERPLTPREERVQFATIEKDLGTVIDKTKDAMNNDWRRALLKLRSEVEGWIDSPHVSPKQILRKAMTATLDLDSFEDRLTKAGLDAYAQGTKQGGLELRKAGLGVKFEARVSPDDPYGLGNYRGLLEARSFQVARGMEQKVLAAIANALQNAYSNGLTAREAKERLNDIFAGLAAGHLISPGTPGHDYSKDAIQETTVRTVANDAFNGARQDLYSRHADFVQGYEISEVADGRESERSHPLSQYLDGLKIRLDHPDAKKLAGSQHYNDRKVDVPITTLDGEIEWSTNEEIAYALQKKAELSPNFV